MNSRGKYETEHKTMEIQTYIYAFITKKHIARLKKLSEDKGSCKLRRNLILYISRKERQTKTEETEGRRRQIHTHNQYEY